MFGSSGMIIGVAGDLVWFFVAAGAILLSAVVNWFRVEARVRALRDRLVRPVMFEGAALRKLAGKESVVIPVPVDPPELPPKLVVCRHCGGKAKLNGFCSNCRERCYSANVFGVGDVPYAAVYDGKYVPPGKAAKIRSMSPMDMLAAVRSGQTVSFRGKLLKTPFDVYEATGIGNPAEAAAAAGVVRAADDDVDDDASFCGFPMMPGGPMNPVDPFTGRRWRARTTPSKGPR